MTPEVLIEEKIKALIKKFFDKLDQIASNRLLEYQVGVYKNNLFTKTFLHRGAPVKLTDIYFPIKLKSPSNSRVIEVESVKRLFDNISYISIFGIAGSGKSTLFKYITIKCIEEKFKIPIKINLRDIPFLEKEFIIQGEQTNNSFVEFITKNILKFNKIATNKDAINEMFESGDFLFLFDGFDEVSSRIKEGLLSDLNTFVERYNKNYFIVSSRPDERIEMLPKFNNYSLEKLSSVEIPLFIEKQLTGLNKKLAKKIIELIRDSRESSYDVFLSNPLLLSMFILTFQSYSIIPEKKSTFYHQVFETLYATHDSISKFAFVREKESGLNKEKFQKLLNYLGFISLFEEKFYFSSEDLSVYFNYFKKYHDNIDFSNEKAVRDINIAISIIIKDGDQYKFPHKSMHEFFAAKYIVNLEYENKIKLLNTFRSSIEERTFDISLYGNLFYLVYELDQAILLKNIIFPLSKETMEEARLIYLS